MENESYREELSSVKTEALFIVLTVVFFLLFWWRRSIVVWNGWTITFLCFTAFFLFYSLNYRTLKISLSPERLQLVFGIFRWAIPLADIESCYRDVDTIWRYGGAGIHFMFVKWKYRAFFNFLEFPRVVIVFKKKKGFAKELAFTTKNPEQVIDFIKNIIS